MKPRKKAFLALALFYLMGSSNAELNCTRGPQDEVVQSFERSNFFAFFQSYCGAFFQKKNGFLLDRFAQRFTQSFCPAVDARFKLLEYDQTVCDSQLLGVVWDAACNATETIRETFPIHSGSSLAWGTLHRQLRCEHHNPPNFDKFLISVCSITGDIQNRFPKMSAWSMIFSKLCMGHPPIPVAVAYCRFCGAVNALTDGLYASRSTWTLVAQVLCSAAKVNANVCVDPWHKSLSLADYVQTTADSAASVGKSGYGDLIG